VSTFTKNVPVITGVTNPDNLNELRNFSDDHKANATAPILTPRSNLVNDTTTQVTLEDNIDLENVKPEESDDEDDDLKSKKGFKAISKDMCETIRVLNPKTNRHKRFFKCKVDNCGRTFAKSCNM